MQGETSKPRACVRVAEGMNCAASSQTIYRASVVYAPLSCHSVQSFSGFYRKGSV